MKNTSPFNPTKLVAGLSLLATLSILTTHAGETWDGTDGKSATSVLGQANFTEKRINRGGAPGADTMNLPAAVAVDPTTGKIFVSDLTNHRVLRFGSAAALTNGAPAEAVLGQPDFSSTDGAIGRSRMRSPRGLAVDRSGRLWAVDSANHRVLRFDNASSKSSGANADGVLGQPDFDSNTRMTTRTGMDSPIGIAVDDAGTLWVGESGNNRVLRFDNAAAKANGAEAGGVLGQPNFIISSQTTSAVGMSRVQAIAVDADGRLWVLDAGKYRVLRFDNAAGQPNGSAANGVLGQINFVSQETGTSATTLADPLGLDIDTEGRLWIADGFNNRVLRFDDAVNKGDGAAADGVLGQSDFESSDWGTSATALFSPVGLCVDGNGRLWVPDGYNHRVLRFQANRIQPDGRIGSRVGRQKGNGTYNRTGAGQKARVSIRGNRTAKSVFTIENDGDVADNFRLRGSRGNRKLKVSYFQSPGGNVTGAMIRGVATAAANSLPAGGKASIRVMIKGTNSSRGRGAGRTLALASTSQTDAETDVVKL